MVTKLCCFCCRTQSTRHLHTCLLAGQLPHQLKCTVPGFSNWGTSVLIFLLPTPRDFGLCAVKPSKYHYFRFQVWTFQRKMKKENSGTLGNTFFLYRLELHISCRYFFANFFAIGTPCCILTYYCSLHPSLPLLRKKLIFGNFFQSLYYKYTLLFLAPLKQIIDYLDY